jgi:alpha-tubulin suppressor-like RCC1 family protein
MLTTPPRNSTRARATLVGCALVLGGCVEAYEVLAVAHIDDASQAVMAANLLSVNGTYGTGPTACAGRGSSAPWSLEIAVGATLTHPELSVVTGDSTCVLTVTSLVADQTYTGSPAFTLTTSYKVTASSFTAGGITFHANARLDSTTFLNDFAMTILASNEPGAGVGDDVTALRVGRLEWSGDALNWQGPYTSFVPTPTQDATASTAWRAISGGDSCAIRTNGSLWCWGTNVDGEIGNGATPTKEWSPVQVGSILTWRSVATGSGHVCANRTDDTLWCWGKNTSGQLGLGHTTSPVLTPTQVGAAVWASVSTEGGTTCATRTDNTLWCWGYNGLGGVGDGTFAGPRLSPVQVAGTDWSTVSAGVFFACGTSTGGALWCWGFNGAGQLGLGHLTHQAAPVQVGTGATWNGVATSVNNTIATRTDGTLWGFGSSGGGELAIGHRLQTSAAVQVGTDLTWSFAATGSGHSCAARTDGTLWCWGLNTSGQLGINSTSSKTEGPVQVGIVATWKLVAADSTHSCATRTDGTLWCWGLNSSGQVGINSVVTPQKVPVQEFTGNATWDDVQTGDAFTCATRTGGTLWCWGLNSTGQIGIGNTTTPQDDPRQESTLATTWDVLAVGGTHACATRANGTLWCWGGNASGQTAFGSVSASVTSPDQVGALTTWKHVAAGGSHTCATRTDGTLWCWGLNDSGQSGTGGTPELNPVQVGSATTWETVALGLAHSCATRTDNTLWCWGRNVEGQLGLGHTTSPQTSPVQVGSGPVFGVFSGSSSNATFSLGD